MACRLPALLLSLLLALIVDQAAGEVTEDSPVHVSGRRHRSESGDALWPVVAVMLLLLVMCGSAIAWCLYLEGQPQIRTTRFCLMLVVAIFALVDVGSCSLGFFQWWLFPASVLLKLLGPLDAVLRFPVVHGFGTLFPWKQLLLLTLQGVVYVRADCTVSQNKVALLAVLLLNVMALPLMYLFALPFHEVKENQSLATRGIVDTDIAVRVARLLVDSRSRHESSLECKRMARVSAVRIAQYCPTAGRWLCRLDPQLQRAMRKTLRAV